MEDKSNFQSLRDAVNEAVDVRDFFVFGGLGLIAFGLWQIDQVLTYIICGSILMLLGLGWLQRGG